MIDLRRPLPLLAMVLAGCASLPSPSGPASRPIGAQLYTVRADMERDPDATLRKVAALGYDEVEFAGLFGRNPADLCATTRKLGMAVAASHADWRLLRDDPAAAISQTRALCSDTLVLAWLPEEERRTVAQWREWATRLNRVEELARAERIAVAYHAHDFEFVPLEGIRPIDVLLADLDPAVAFELDVYWAAKAGVDPLAFLRAHGQRITHLHLKDMARGSAAMADVGAGRLDFAAIVREARRQGVRHLIVERDDAPDPWASLAASLDYLRAIPLQQGSSPSQSGTPDQ